MIKSLDGTVYIVTSSSRTGGPMPKGSSGIGGQAFGTSFLYISKDDGYNWFRVGFRSKLQTENWITANNDSTIKLETDAYAAQ